MSGVMSSIPTRGTTRRRGARTGSVMELRKVARGLRGAIGNQEMRARAMRAKVRT